MFDWVLNMALGNTIKKIILKIFPHLRKTFFFTYHAYFILSQKSEKCVAGRNKKL